MGLVILLEDTTHRQSGDLKPHGDPEDGSQGGAYPKALAYPKVQKRIPAAPIATDQARNPPSGKSAPGAIGTAAFSEPVSTSLS